MICYSFTEPLYLIFSPDLPALFYYSHIVTAIVAIFVGFFVLKSGKKLLLNRLLFAISICFFFWVVSNIILWTNIHSNIMLFVWSLLRILSSMMSILSIYFLYVFLEKKDISFFLKGIFLVLILPVIILAPTYINLSGFNLATCDAFMFEGGLFQFYRVAFGILAMLWILILLIRRYHKADVNFKKQILLVGVGIELFLLSFFIVTFLAAYFTKIGLLPDSRLEYYGLFGIIIFVIYLSILTVKFGAFNIKLLASQALVWGLVILIGAQFFFIKITANFVLNGIAFIGILIAGPFLIKSVKKEVNQRELLESLTLKLEQSNSNFAEANEKLKGLDKLKTEFVSLASHQLRSPLTAIKGYISMLIEGDYGEINPKAKEIVDRVAESSNNLTLVVEDLLNVSKIESGGMKYDMVKFDFSELVNNTAKDLSITAEKKGLKLTHKIDMSHQYFVDGDKEKLRQVLINLIDNSMKYTEKGKIELDLDNQDGKITLSVKDTGAGVDPEVEDTIFEKFSRGEGAKLNASGSGLGLYLVKEIVEAHHGRVWVESLGVGKGSTFFVELNEVK